DREFVAMFGPAGAGKTTTLNLIAGIVTPNRGSVRIAGRDIGGLEPGERNVAMVFESYALYPQLNVFDNMAFPLRSPKFKLPEEAVKARVTQYAKVMKIDHLLNRQITALSNGQRQRTALGRALVRKPHIFLMDEPLSHLDAKLRHSMRAELKEMRSQLGTTTLYVTHDYLEAMSLGDRIVVIDQGRVQQVGSPDEVYFRPASTRVARLFGDPEVNLLEATLQSRGGTRLEAQVLGEKTPLPVPADAAQVLQKRGKDRVRLGFRPADVQVFGDNEPNAFRGSVYSFEPLGAKSILTVQAGDGSRIRALIDGHLKFELDQGIRFSIDPHALMIFDADTEEFLVRSAEPKEATIRGHA
ncbi:MAG: ABC transporter ATP-binding protein, partial [Verrucomicrobia bacterium]|nr:ABC transporter ATP-binding protein [Verrucomicrobiota bacterium]